MSYITKQRVYDLIKEAAIYAPATEAQPKTFAVIDSLQDFNLENLGFIAADLDTSDLWARGNKTANNFKLEYPMVAMIPMGATVEDATRVTHNVRIMYVDRVHREKITEGERNTDGAIMDNAVQFLMQLQIYMGNVRRHGILFNDNSEATGYYNTELLDYLMNNDNISEYNTAGSQAEAVQFEKDISDAFAGFRVTYITYPVTEDLIIGGWAEFAFTVIDCTEPEFDYYYEGDFKKSRKVYAGR